MLTTRFRTEPFEQMNEMVIGKLVHENTALHKDWCIFACCGSDCMCSAESCLLLLRDLRSSRFVQKGEMLGGDYRIELATDLLQKILLGHGLSIVKSCLPPLC